MAGSELHPHLARGHHPIRGVARLLAAGLAAQALLALLCAVLAPLGAEVQRGAEEFASAYRAAHWAALLAFLPLLALWLVWLARVRANLRAVTGDVVGPAHVWPDLSEGVPLDGEDALQLARDVVLETAEGFSTIADGVERRRGTGAVRALDVAVFWTWLLGGLALAGIAILDVLERDPASESLFASAPMPVLYLLWGAGALLTAVVVRRVTRLQMLALPRR